MNFKLNSCWGLIISFLVSGILGFSTHRAFGDEGACLTEMHRILATHANGDYEKRLKARKLAQMFLAARKVLQSEVAPIKGNPHLRGSTFYPVKFVYRGVVHKGGFLVGLEPATPQGVGFPEWVIKFYPDSQNKELILKIVYKTHEKLSNLSRDQLARFVERQFMEMEMSRLQRRARAVGGSFQKAKFDAEQFESKLKAFIQAELNPLEAALEKDKISQIITGGNAAVFAGLDKLSRATDEDLFSPISLFTEEAEACKLGGAPFQLFTYF